MCSAAFENLGFDLLKESPSLNLGIAWSTSGQADSGCVSEKDQSEETNSIPIFHWLQSGMCNHVIIRSQADDIIIYESDEFDYESDDDLDKELDLEVYGIKVTPQPSLPGDITPKSPAVMSPFSPHLHPPEAGYYSASPALNALTQLDKTFDINKELTEATDKINLTDSENLFYADIMSSAFRCGAPCPDDQPAVRSPAYFTEPESDTPDIDISPQRKQSVAEILAADQSEKDCSRMVKISPLVSPLKVSSSSPPRWDGTNSQVETEDAYHGEEVIEADVKFAGMTPIHVASSR